MTEPTDTPGPETPTPPPEHAAEVAAAKKASRLPKIIVGICLVLGLLLGAGIALTRYGVLLPQGRLMIEARTDGLKIGRFGKLKIEGLTGDLWRDFNIRRLTISDSEGVWLEARRLHVEWSYLALFSRRFQADEITAEQVRVLKRPTLEPSQPSAGLPISFDIDLFKARVELLPEFSTRRGVYDIAGGVEVGRRNSGQSGLINARSVLHPGDKLDVTFSFGGERPLVLKAQALEAQGGALAGALGLPADQAFALDAQAGGKMSAGSFRAVATVGQAKPLEAQGAWTPNGGQAQGRLSLVASTLTAPLAQRFGPELVFKGAGSKAGPDLHQLDLTLDAENLAVVARGQANLGKQMTGPQGVAITVSAPKMSRILPAPEMGAAQISGVLTGKADDLTFAGDLAVQKVALGAYSLRRLAGPVRVTRDKTGLSVTASPKGEGGAGSELFAALLGGAPRADLEVRQLADGRWLFRKLNVAGSGLKVQASGDRSLLGGLTFKGDAQLSNLKAARIGASGGLNASWRAAQAKGGAPWTFGVDARGQNFASGFSELDRLLGGKPTLEAQASFADGKVSIARARLNGAALQANAAGAVGPRGALAVKADWSANGPFRAGPVEITGKAKGTGGVTGTVAAPRVDLIADVDAVDLPQLPLKNAHVTLTFMQAKSGASGTATLAATSTYGPAKASGDFRFPRGGVELSNVLVDAAGVQARGAVSLRRAAPSAADLQVAIGPGVLLDAGKVSGAVRIVDSAGGPRGDLDLTVDRARPKGAPVFIRSGKLSAHGPLSRLPYTIEARGGSSGGRWQVSGQGQFSQEDPGFGLTFAGDGRLGRRDVHTVEPAVLRFGGGTQSARLRLAATGGGLVNVDAKLAGDTADLQAQLSNLDLQLLNEDLDGKIDATASLEGRGSALGGTLEAKLEDARGRGSATSQGMDANLSARLAGDDVIIQAAATNEQGLKATADLTLPAEASAKPLRLAINRQRPMRGKVLADGEIKPLWDLLVGGERSLSGKVHLEGTIGGSLADPTAVGQASVDGGRFQDGATGLLLQDVVLRAGLASNAIDITQATGQDGRGGTLAGSGRISLTRNGASSFRLDLKRFRLIDNDMATAIASGQATIDRGGDGKVRLAGDMVIDEANVAADPPTPSGVVAMEVIERNKPRDYREEFEPQARTGAGAVALDVKLHAPRRIYLRGRGLDLEMALDAHVGGTTAQPLLTGAARVVRGDYDFAGKRFEFDDRGTVQLSTNPAAIRLDLTATREDPSLTAVVRIRGTAAKPEITLTSSPVLPNDEVLSQVLFGRSASQLSPLEAAQLASALSALAGGGGFDVIGGLRSFAGLDRLALVGGDESGFSVAGGKYLTEDIYLEIIGGGRDGPAAQVEWRFSRSLSFLSKLTGQGDTRLSVRWRRDY